jgi:diguanylate cyclase (GGDEF)-like protein
MKRWGQKRIMTEKESRLGYDHIAGMFDQYLDKRAYQQAEHPSVQWIKIFVCVSSYLVIMALQTSQNVPDYINGIYSQLLALICIYLSVNVARKGFFVSIALNLFNLTSIFLAIFSAHKTTAVTGMITGLSTLVAVSIIHILFNRNAQQFSEVVKQKEELLLLSEEMAASGEELRQQNETLLESYQVISENEEKLNYLAYFDPLTELPNRKMILDRLDLLVHLAQKNNSSFAVVFIDLDDFKKINDTMGHQIGDQVIVSVASRLSDLIHKGDLLGRLGGDEFALIIQQNLRDEDILQYVENLRKNLERSLNIDRFDLSIRASFGISIYPHDGSTPLELIKCADTAMYKAKETGKNSIYFFRKEMQAEIWQKMDFENKLAAALQNEEFFLAFQPQYLANSKTLRGFEALVRWQSPDYGLLGPVKFIPTAEETGLIIPLGQWILHTACYKFKELMEQHDFSDVILSVNISAIQFDDPNFVPMLKNVLAESLLPARNLELEITESVLIKSVEQAIRILAEIKNMGVRIALDDFGTGYSSLRYLQLLPIDTLKIDKSFVDNISNKDRNQQVVGAIISLVHQMNIFVVAEGVENDIQLNYLQNEACDSFQGFLLGRPLTIPEIIKNFVGTPRISQ